MTSIFIDSGAFVAVYREKDLNHETGVKKLDELIKTALQPVTSDYILDETYTGILTRVSYKMAADFDQKLSASHWRIEKITPDRFTKAQEIFRRFNKDKVWSFTDCTSYVVMKELKIKHVFTFDNNFSEMGFKLL